MLPKRAGDRVKTDRREARQLARRMRSGDLTPVYVPAGDDAAIRDLRRARAETLRDLTAAKWRRTACWRRHDIRSTGRANWSPAHLRWRSAVIWPTPAHPIVLQAYVQTVTEQPERLGRLELERHEQGQTWRFQPGVEALQALRGVQGTVAVSTGAALGDLTRVDTPRQLMHSLGLTPSAYASGARRQQGSMTKTGHRHARRAVVEGAWASRYPATVSRPLHLRLEKLPAALQALRWKAQVRRCTRSRHLLATGPHAPQGGGAIARELRAFMWALAQQVAGSPKAERGRRVDAHGRSFPPLSDETQPRCGVILGGVQRPQGPLGPRMRQAPDGCTYGGTQPTAIRVLNRRVFLAPALPRDETKGKNMRQT